MYILRPLTLCFCVCAHKHTRAHTCTHTHPHVHTRAHAPVFMAGGPMLELRLRGVHGRRSYV